MTKKNPFKQNKHEILYKLINSLLSGFIAFLGAISDGQITASGIMVCIFVSLSIAVIQFKQYWETQESEYKKVWVGKLI